MIELVQGQTSRVTLSQPEVQELSHLTRGSLEIHREPRVIQQLVAAGCTGTYDILPGPYVGRICLGTARVVDITAWFPFPDIAALLGLAARATLLRETAAPALDGHGLPELVALAFVREAERIAGEGLAKSYQRIMLSRPPYAGTPSITAHLNSHAGRPDRLVTQARRLTTNIPLNHLIAQAHRKLCQLTYHDKQIGVRLRQLTPVFRYVDGGTNEQTSHIAAVPPRYRDIHNLADVIVRDWTVLPTGTGFAGVSALFNMWKIWEACVRRWLCARRPGDVVRGPHEFPLVDDGAPKKAIADAIVERNGRPIEVYDAKYQRWKKSPSTEDLYQLFTYASRLSVDYAALVYPSSEAKRSRMTIGDVAIESIAVPVTTISVPSNEQ